MPPSDSTTSTPLSLLRECQERRLEREGVPMVLALKDERGTATPSRHETTLTDGRAYADLLEKYQQELVPPSTFHDGDEGALISALVVLAYAHFFDTRGDLAR